MHRRTVSLSLLAVALVLGSRTVPAGQTSQRLVAHEWGTFTSIAGEQGQAVPWRPLDGPSDLPCFVERHRLCIKCSVAALVRMETPVIYFYADKDVDVNVAVTFRQGLVTEWYPSANVTPTALPVGATPFSSPSFASLARWPRVSIRPGSPERYPTEPAESHYYAARRTDAAPVVVGGQQEKFLFYRGVGDFEPPVSATVAPDGSIRVSARSDAPLGTLILFENRDGSMAYSVRHVASRSATLAAPTLDGEAMPPTAELEQALIADGLYPKEARAMVETWRDSWFEEGTRLFYLAPRAVVDSRLPLVITPAPDETVRTFVGRVELFTARSEGAVRTAIDRRDGATLARFGRFAGPIAERVLWRDPTMENRRFQALMQPIYAAAVSAPRSPSCR